MQTCWGGVTHFRNCVSNWLPRVVLRGLFGSSDQICGTAALWRQHQAHAILNFNRSLLLLSFPKSSFLSNRERFYFIKMHVNIEHFICDSNNGTYLHRRSLLVYLKFRIVFITRSVKLAHHYLCLDMIIFGEAVLPFFFTEKV